MSYEFTDPFLVRRVTPERIAAAEADVAALTSAAQFSDFWRARLVVLRAYVIAATENQAEAGDLYAEKIAHYSREYDRALVQARAQAQAAQAGSAGAQMYSVPIARA